MTPRQHEVWRFVDGFIRQRGYSPSYAEVQVAIGVRSKSSVHRTVDLLVRDGFLAQRGRLPRSLSVLRAPRGAGGDLTRQQFRNALCIMRSIDCGDVPCLSGQQWREFAADPYRFFLRADDTVASAIWQVVEARAHGVGA